MPKCKSYGIAVAIGFAVAEVGVLSYIVTFIKKKRSANTLFIKCKTFCRLWALSLHKISCTRETVSKLTFLSFALSLHPFTVIISHKSEQTI